MRNTREILLELEDSLGNWLKKNNIPGIYGVDTRALTKRLREKGTMLGRIICNKQDIEFYDPNRENRFPSETGFWI
ncbi:Carbamoyl-phosphate synthase small chain [subsurface metagenome]